MKSLQQHNKPAQGPDWNKKPFFKKEESQSFFSNEKDPDGSESPFFAAAGIQTKLNIGKPDDKYEKEADSAADQLMAGNRMQNGSAAIISPKIQRKEETQQLLDVQKQEEEEEAIQPKLEVQKQEEEEEAIQPKLEVQKQEEEEEAIQPKLEVQKQEEEEEAIQPKLEVQKQEEEEEAIQPKLEVQKQEEEEEAIQPKLEVQKQEEEEEAIQPKLEVQKQEEEEEAIQPKLEVQKKGEEEEESMQMKLDVQKQEEEEEAIQPKLEVQKQEEEEEAIQPKLEVQKQEEEEEALQPKLELQKQEEEEVQAKSNGSAQPPQGFESQLKSSKGTGSPLSEPVRTEMEGHFGADFSGVNIHTDSKSSEMNQSINAQAFTHGKDVFFNEGKYKPESGEGKHLLAHELTHTLQQGEVDQVSPKEQAQTPDVQMLSMEELVELAKELANSNKEAVDATDPTPAENAREEAKEELTEEGTGQDKKQETEGPPDDPKSSKPEVRGEKPKKTVNVPQSGLKEIKKGPAGEFLDKTSEHVLREGAKKATELAANEQTHEDAAAKTKNMDDAVVPPALEGQAKSNTGQVGNLDNKPKPKPDAQKAKKKLDSAVQESVPDDIEAMNEFKSKGKAKVVGNEVLGTINEDVSAVQETYNEIEEAPPPAEMETPTELPPEEAAPETPPLDMGKDAVPELQEEHTDFSNFENDSDDLLKKEEISDEQLDMVDTGDLAEANKDRKDLKTKVSDEPAKIKEFAQGEKTKVDSDLKEEEAKGKAEMKEKRKESLGNTSDKQVKTKTEKEKKREAVTEKINKIYEKAKTEVTTKLDALEKQNLVAFDTGQQRFSNEFEKEVNRKVGIWKDDRYSGLFGGVKWLKDKIFGIDHFPEVKRIFEDAKTNYIKKIDELIVKITADNDKTIVDCKQILADAKTEIKDFVDKLGPELKKLGEQSMKEMESKLNEMDKLVDKKKEELQQKLAAKREEAIKKIDEKIEKMKEEMGGLLSKLGNLLLNAMIKFFKWALEAAGFATDQIMGILNKGKAVIKAIVTKPIKFIGNIVSAVGNGIKNFSKNIKKHLVSGLVNWLTGAMGDVAITLPEKWDLKGIFSFILQVLGVGWDIIRQKLVKRVGEKVVAVAEKSVDIIKKLITEGPIALWGMIKDKAGEIKTTVMEGIRNFVAIELVKQGITKLLSFLNPAGAIVQAILAIYNTVMFFVENWDRIVDLVKTIFGAISDIAMGKLSAAAQAVEKAMAITIPIILNFILRLLGLGGIGKKILEIIKKIRKPIDKVVGKVINFLVKKAKKLFGKGKKGKKKVEKEADVSAKDKKKHEKYVKEIVKALDKTDKKDSQLSDEQFHQKKKKLAQDLEKKYKPKVKKGIKVKIELESSKGLEKDNDLDYTVKIAPNATTGKSAAKKADDGRVTATKANVAEAKKKLNAIKIGDVGGGIDQDTLDDYKTGKHGRKDNYTKYIDSRREEYIKNRSTAKDIDWPLQYLQRRWTLHKGKHSESEWIEKKFPGAGKNNTAHTVTYTNSVGEQETRSVIPDYITSSDIGDVKNVAEQSFTGQLRAVEQLARDEGKKFSIIIRHKNHPKGETSLSGPLNTQAKGKYKIIKH